MFMSPTEFQSLVNEFGKLFSAPKALVNRDNLTLGQLIVLSQKRNYQYQQPHVRISHTCNDGDNTICFLVQGIYNSLQVTDSII